MVIGKILNTRINVSGCFGVRLMRFKKVRVESDKCNDHMLIHDMKLNVTENKKMMVFCSLNWHFVVDLLLNCDLL